MSAPPVIVFRVSRDGRCLDYKATTEEALSMPPAELLGRTLADVLPPEVAQPAMESIARALRIGEVQCMTYVLPLNSDTREGEAQFERTDPDAVSVLVRDVTDRKRMEEAFRQGEARFRSMFETAAAAMVTADLEGRLLEVNPAFASGRCPIPPRSSPRPRGWAACTSWGGRSGAAWPRRLPGRTRWCS
jgi:PAS domain S-box-containing protein